MVIFYPVQQLADWVTGNVLGLTSEAYLARTLNFFIYDTIKIGLLLVAINFVMAITRYYFPTEKVRDLLTTRRWFGLDYVLAAFLGMVTPFCSCSSIPLFIGFVSSGIPLGVTFTFLIASPLINEASLILFPALFGVKTTVIYNLVGLVVAVIGGVIIQNLHLEKYVNSELIKFKSKAVHEAENGGEKMPFKKLVRLWWSDGMGITKSIFPYVVLGVGVGAFIHGFVPAALIEKYLAVKAWWTIPVATLVGVPIYVNSVSVIPIVEALVGKGIPMGTALAFMTAAVTLSIPEVLILKKVMKLPLLLTFFGITTTGIMILGYVFNYL